MIQVIYRWTVSPERADAFEAAWGEVTRHIQMKASGARGSVLLRSAVAPEVFVAVAKWDSHAAWQASRLQIYNIVPAEVAAAMKAAVSGPGQVEIFNEIRALPGHDP